MWPETTRQAPPPLLPSCAVDTNEALRQWALRLITLGCSQKIMAAKMGMQASTFSRWINQKSDVAPVSVTALDGFNAYVRELRDALSDESLHAIRQFDTATVHAPAAAPAESLQKDNGRSLAVPAAARGQAAPLSTPATRLSEEFERETQAEERRETRATRRHVAAPRTKTAGSRARPPKNRR